MNDLEDAKEHCKIWWRSVWAIFFGVNQLDNSVAIHLGARSMVSLKMSLLNQAFLVAFFRIFLSNWEKVASITVCAQFLRDWLYVWVVSLRKLTNSSVICLMLPTIDNTIMTSTDHILRQANQYYEIAMLISSIAIMIGAVRDGNTTSAWSSAWSARPMISNTFT